MSPRVKKAGSALPPADADFSTCWYPTTVALIITE